MAIQPAGRLTVRFSITFSPSRIAQLSWAPRRVRPCVISPVERAAAGIVPLFVYRKAEV
jgi:hypothetical protein